MELNMPWKITDKDDVKIVDVKLPKLSAKLKARRFNERNMVWKTADGKSIRVQDMADFHLLNCIRLLERRAEEYRKQFKITVSNLNIVTSQFPIYVLMVIEMEKRLNKQDEKEPTELVITTRPKRRFSA